MRMFQLLAGNSSPSPPDRSHHRRTWQAPSQAPSYSNFVPHQLHGPPSARHDSSNEAYDGVYYDDGQADYDAHSFEVHQSRGISGLDL